MRRILLCLSYFLIFGFPLIYQVARSRSLPPQDIRAVPTFTGSFVTDGKPYSYTFAGQKPESGGTTTIPTVVVPLSLSFEASGAVGGGNRIMDATRDVAEILDSPIFSPFPFATGNTQFADAVQRAQFPGAAKSSWHTLLGHPRVLAPIHIDVPTANGYILHSRKTGKSLAIADLDFVQQQLFTSLANSGIRPDSLLLAVTKNVEFYLLGDATVCCSIGTHGAQVDSSNSSAQSFVIGSYFDEGALPHFADVQAISQQVAEWMNDPLYNSEPNKFPSWVKPESSTGCGGSGESSSYLMEQPADFVPESSSTKVSHNGHVYHLENIALLPWFAQSGAPESFGKAYSFPDTKALAGPAQPCSNDRARNTQPTAHPIPHTTTKSDVHALIGYWEGYSSVRNPTPLRDVSPEWDIVITTFAAPVKGSTSVLHFQPPAELGDEKFKADVTYLKSQGKKVLISIGGGGEVVTLNTPTDVQNFLDSITAIVEKYGFDGVDLDIETPSIILAAGDKDFRHPSTPSVLNLIAAMHRLRAHFGDKFMIAEVPEAAQAQAGFAAYGGQFGSFLPVIYGTRDILSFVDAQDYNTPPLQGLDGNYYFPGNADYHVAMSEMLVAGFPVGGNSKIVFPPLLPNQVAIGLPATPTSARNYTAPAAIENALGYLIEGKPYGDAAYSLRRSSGYPTFLGAMFWAINEDRRNDFEMSNAIGPFLHNIKDR